jgi:hypothetical protein
MRSPRMSRRARPRSWLTHRCRWGVDAVGGTITEPARRSKPSWYLIVTDDRMIPPQQQRVMAERVGAMTTEVPGNHAIYVSQPSAIGYADHDSPARLDAACPVRHD